MSIMLPDEVTQLLIQKEQKIRKLEGEVKAKKKASVIPTPSRLRKPISADKSKPILEQEEHEQKHKEQ